METFQEIFSTEFKKTDHTAESLANVLDCDTSYVYSMKNGLRTPGRKMGAKISLEFNINLKTLLQAVDYQKAPDNLKKDFETNPFDRQTSELLNIWNQMAPSEKEHIFEYLEDRLLANQVRRSRTAQRKP